MKIIKCTENFVEVAGKFYDEVVLFLETHTNYPRWMLGNYPSIKSVQEATTSGTQYICLQNNQVVGAFVLNTDPQGNYQAANWSRNIQEGDYFVIHAFATHPNFYRQGIAEKMLNFCIEEAQRCKMQAIRLDVVPDNYPAQKFYLKHGFSFVAELDLNRGFKHIPTFCLYELNF